MADTESPRGLIIDLITPIRDDGSIDRSGLHRHLERVLPHVHGLFLCGPDAGGGLTLGQTQREDMLDTVMERVRETIPLMVWITGASQDETAGTLQALESKAARRTYGGPLFWVDTPLLYHSNRGLSRHYQDLLSFSSRPIILFNDPERVKQAARPLKRTSIRTAVLKEIAHLEGMCGLFYRGTMDRARNYQKAVRFRSLFRIYDGDEALFLDHPSRHGVLSAGANLAPKDWQRITDSSMDTTSEQKSYPGHLRQVWESGQVLHALHAAYADRPAHRIQAALARLGVLDSSATLGKLSSEDEESVERLCSLVKGR